MKAMSREEEYRRLITQRREIPSLYQIREAGRNYCQTEGSEHYKEGGIEPLDLSISKGFAEDFCLANIIKYATRYKVTRNLDDLKKVSDYAHIACGIELLINQPDKEITITKEEE